MNRHKESLPIGETCTEFLRSNPAGAVSVQIITARNMVLKSFSLKKEIRNLKSEIPVLREFLIPLHHLLKGCLVVQPRLDV